MWAPQRAPQNSVFKLSLHEGQEKAWWALEDPEIREVALVAGIQGGKTTFGSLAVVRAIAHYSKLFPNCNYIVGADNYKTLSQATIPTLLKVLPQQAGRYVGGKEEFILKTGGKIFFRTATDPNSVEGIPDCAFAWIDEAGKCSKLFQINVLGRVARLKGKVLYTSTPYALNWLWTDVEKPAEKGERKDIFYIRFSSADNPSFPQEEFERQKALLDAKTFRRKYMGIHERMEGLVYEITGENYIAPYTLPRDTQFYAGVDFGFTEGHEFSIIIRAITPDGYHFDINEFKQAGVDPNQQVMMAKSKKETFHVKHFFCDPARPDMIAMFNNAGLSASAFHIGKEDFKRIIPGINKHIELIKSGKYKIFTRACPHLEDEYETYHWPEANEEKFVKEEPVKLNDNLMDAVRYVTIGTMHIKPVEIIQPFVSRHRPDIDHFDPRKTPKKKDWNSY